jgi:NSS family neurotransmitter:Na+ symporter
VTLPARETFTSRFGTLMTMIGVAVGLGNVWRFPYMVGRFGGAAFVLLYILAVVTIGVPALMAEWALGRHTRRGPVGAFSAGGLPFGRYVGWFFFFVVSAATAYYTGVVGWVLYFAAADVAAIVVPSVDASAILPPDEGFSPRSFVLQMACTATVILACAVVLIRGLRSGIEAASKFIMPTLLVILLVLVVRSLTLPGAMEGVQWYLLKFSLADINAKVMMAAMGQAIFSLSLGGTFMVVYGSYLKSQDRLAGNAAWTALGDMSAGLLAGLAIIPAAMALGMEPSQGPGLLFSTLPDVFAAISFGWLFGFLFFAGLFGAAYLSDVAAFEVLVAGLTDNTRVTRTRAVWIMSGVVFLLAIPPSINNRIFIPWDLTFGSGMQTLGSLLAVLTIGWCMHRSVALKALGAEGGAPVPAWLFYWIRFGIPAAILSVGVWWLMTAVFGTIAGV